MLVGDRLSCVGVKSYSSSVSENFLSVNLHHTVQSENEERLNIYLGDSSYNGENIINCAESVIKVTIILLILLCKNINIVVLC